MSNELEPCPFCGGRPRFEDNWYSVACVRCGADGPAGKPEEAIEAWNTRALSTPKPDDIVVERLRALMEKATPGPWQTGDDGDLWDVLPNGDPGVPLFRPDTGPYRAWGRKVSRDELIADAALIVELRNALPHLLNTRATGEGERKLIVDWLRSDVGKGSEEGVDYADGFADQIEAGAHLATIERCEHLAALSTPVIGEGGMSAAKFTPGPWHAERRWSDEQINIFGADGRLVTSMPDSNEALEDDALLIAAAPELYEALAHIIGAAHEAPRFGPFDQIDNTGEPYQSADMESALAKGRAALAKAQGTQP